MNLIPVKTADLTGAALDWAVADCEGYTNARFHREPPLDGGWIMDPPRKEYGPVLLGDLAFSADWSQGGPIIEREFLDVWHNGFEWVSRLRRQSEALFRGPTPLIAAMRCYVASKKGDTVMVPAELVES
jgi:hypothetical protein